VAEDRRRAGRRGVTTGRTPASESAKDVVMSRIRAALGDAPAPGEIPRHYERTLPSGADILELFVERVSDYRAIVHRTRASELADTIATVLASRRAARIVVPAGLPHEWLARSDAEATADDPPLSYADLDGLDGVVTGCATAIAETGTIVLDAGADQGRRAISLLPDLHVCVVMARQVAGTVPEALARLDPARPQTWISGPSATSDIELQRVEGVHGPRTLDVVLVED
jgi:L-lactate dehydrogenase complex protein LldG